MSFVTDGQYQNFRLHTSNAMPQQSAVQRMNIKQEPSRNGNTVFLQLNMPYTAS
jgi:hypothetical protein